MGKVLERLLQGSPARRIDEPDGLNLYPLDGHQEEFDALVRLLAEQAGTEYVAFPRPAGPRHYDAILVVPLD